MTYHTRQSGWTVGTALAALIVAGGAGMAAAGDGLTIFEWSGYEDPEIHKAYTA